MSDEGLARMRTVADVYPSRWLKAEDLGQRAVTVTIKAARAELVRQRDGTSKAKIVLAFDRAQKEMICNVTQARAIATLLGSEEFSTWTGKAIGLTQGSAPNGKLTIVVLAPWGGRRAAVNSERRADAAGAVPQQTAAQGTAVPQQTAAQGAGGTPAVPGGHGSPFDADDEGLGDEGLGDEGQEDGAGL